jgi:hypothetical protein
MPATQEHSAPYRPDFAPVAALMADSTRAVMLNALLLAVPWPPGNSAGALGAAVTARLFELDWIERGPRRRSIRVTDAGRDGLVETFGWSARPAAPEGASGALASSAGGRP